MLTLAAGLTLLALLADADRGYLSVLPGLLLIGAGVGLAMSPSTTAITSSLTEDKQGVASALNDTVREIGAAMGLALIGSVLNSRFRTNITDLANTYPAETAARIKEGIGGALSTAAQLGPDGQPLVTAARRRLRRRHETRPPHRRQPRRHRRRLHRMDRPPTPPTDQRDTSANLSSNPPTSRKRETHLPAGAIRPL